mgnify:CR=1 FL=1
MSTKDFKFLVFGYGYLSKAIVQIAKKNNYDLTIVSRKKIKDNIFKSICYNRLNDIKNDLKHYFAISTVPPNENGEDYVLNSVDKNIISTFSKIIYISSTSVYPSGLVNEDSITSNLSERGKIRNKIENEWKSITNTIIVRPGGIYCNENNVMTKFLRGNHEIIFKKDHYTNRIHIEDLVGIIFKTLLFKNPPKVINAVDEDFVITYDVVKEICKKFNLPNPKKINYKNKIISQNSRSFFQVSKQVKSKYVTKKMNYQFKHKNFSKSLTEITKIFLQKRTQKI